MRATRLLVVAFVVALGLTFVATASAHEIDSRKREARKAVFEIFGPQHWPAAKIIIGCETGHTWKQSVAGDSGNSVSIWQIHMPTWEGEILRDFDGGVIRVNRAWVVKHVRFATRVAWGIYHIKGQNGMNRWRPWTCARKNGLG